VRSVPQLAIRWRVHQVGLGGCNNNVSQMAAFSDPVDRCSLRVAPWMRRPRLGQPDKRGGSCCDSPWYRHLHPFINFFSYSSYTGTAYCHSYFTLRHSALLSRLLWIHILPTYTMATYIGKLQITHYIPLCRILWRIAETSCKANSRVAEDLGRS
jgi:hypothetical protein